MTTMDLTCALSALFFFLSNLLGIILVVKDGNKSHFDFDLWKQLDPEYLQQDWAFRKDVRGLAVTAGIINALAWFVFSIPILQVAWILSRGGKRKICIHACIMALALGGSITELVSRLLLIGMNTTAIWISDSFNLDQWLSEDQNGNDNIGWRALEVTHLVSSGMLLWIDAFEWLALFGILSLIFVSVRTMPNSNKTSCFGLNWARLGLVIALLSIIDFASDVLRLQSWKTFMFVAAAISVLNTLILLPIWLILLGRQLPNAMPKYVEEEDDFVNGHVSAQNQQPLT